MKIEVVPAAAFQDREGPKGAQHCSADTWQIPPTAPLLGSVRIEYQATEQSCVRLRTTALPKNIHDSGTDHTVRIDQQPVGLGVATQGNVVGGAEADVIGVSHHLQAGFVGL